jgi:hypothetical protein
LIAGEERRSHLDYSHDSWNIKNTDSASSEGWAITTIRKTHEDIGELSDCSSKSNKNNQTKLRLFDLEWQSKTNELKEIALGATLFSHMHLANENERK